MNTLEKIIHSASQNKQRIVLPEGEDPRIAEAALKITAEGIADITLVGDPDRIQALLGKSATWEIRVIDPGSDEVQTRYAPILQQARQHKGMTLEQAAALISDPLTLGATLVRAGDASGMVAGATHATADVVRSALQLIGMSKNSKIVSSFFLMEHALPHQAIQGTAIYADCGMVIEPDSNELACIAIDSADSAINLAGMDPKVALLSFSTAGSAKHPNVDKVKQAGEIIASERPDLKLMTEVQFDSAILPSVLEQKAPDIKVTAPANVFVFPDLQSGNIGYKIAQRIGGVQAIGPILQGLNQPINDLSRGCSVDDIVNLVAVTAVQSINQK